MHTAIAERAALKAKAKAATTAGLAHVERVVLKGGRGGKRLLMDMAQRHETKEEVDRKATEKRSSAM